MLGDDGSVFLRTAGRRETITPRRKIPTPFTRCNYCMTRLKVPTSAAAAAAARGEESQPTLYASRLVIVHRKSPCPLPPHNSSPFPGTPCLLLGGGRKCLSFPPARQTPDPAPSCTSPSAAGKSTCPVGRAGSAQPVPRQVRERISVGSHDVRHFPLPRE